MRPEAESMLAEFSGVSGEGWKEAAAWALQQHEAARDGTVGGILRVRLLTLQDDDLRALIRMFDVQPSPARGNSSRANLGTSSVM